MTKPSAIWKHFSKTVPADRILWKDYLYMARILVKKNQDYPKMADDLTSLEINSLTKKKPNLPSASTAAEKTKDKASH